MDQTGIKLYVDTSSTSRPLLHSLYMCTHVTSLAFISLAYVNHHLMVNKTKKYDTESTSWMNPSYMRVIAYLSISFYSLCVSWALIKIACKWKRNATRGKVKRKKKKNKSSAKLLIGLCAHHTAHNFIVNVYLNVLTLSRSLPISPPLSRSVHFKPVCGAVFIGCCFCSLLLLLLLLLRISCAA